MKSKSGNSKSPDNQLDASNSKLTVGVLAGGPGGERDVSIQSGAYIAEALKDAGFNVKPADVGPGDVAILDDNSIDVFFVAVHGEFGEDGQLQQILEEASVVYTGSGPAASKLAFDKIASKKVFAEAGINTPAAIEFNGNADTELLKKQLQGLADKYVIKPVRQGSTIGVSIVEDCDEVIAAAGKTASEFGDCMIEEFIPGREITVGILRGQALPIIEVRTRTGFYDYQSKYFDEQTEYLFDTVKDPALAEQIQTAALRCFDVLGCRDFARVDFRLSDNQQIYVLEVNTIPGFTSHSLLPMAAAKAGLSMSDLCVKIVEAALEKTSIDCG